MSVRKATIKATGENVIVLQFLPPTSMDEVQAIIEDEDGDLYAIELAGIRMSQPLMGNG